MRNSLHIFMTLLLVAVASPSCSGTPQATTNPPIEGENMQNNQLTLTFSMSLAMMVGYGAEYTCTLHEVVEGEFEMEQFTLTVLQGENDKLPPEAYNNKPITVSFQRHQEDEPYRVSPLTGFVDQDRTSWKVLAEE